MFIAYCPAEYPGAIKAPPLRGLPTRRGFGFLLAFLLAFFLGLPTRFIPIPSTLPLTAPATPSIIAGATALRSDDMMPLPFFVPFGLPRFFIPKPDIPIKPLSASPIIPSPSISGVYLSTCELALSANFWIPDLA